MASPPIATAVPTWRRRCSSWATVRATTPGNLLSRRLNGAVRFGACRRSTCQPDGSRQVGARRLGGLGCRIPHALLLELILGHLRHPSVPSADGRTPSRKKISMAIQHTVVFRLAHKHGSAAESEFLDTARAILTGIDGVTEFTINRQISAKSDLDWQFSMVFPDQAAYDAYNKHPTHVGFVETRWVPQVTSFQEYDFIAR